MANMLTHPLLVLVSQFSIAAISVGFTAPGSRLRWLALLMQAGLAGTVVRTSFAHLGVDAWASVATAAAVGAAMQHLEVALFSRWSFEGRGPERIGHDQHKKSDARPLPDSPWQRLRFGSCAIFAARACGTPREVKGVPPFSSRSPTYVPSRRRFLWAAVLKFVMCYLALDLAEMMADPAKNEEIFALEKVPIFTRLRDIDSQELVVRAVATFVFWAILYFVLQLLWSVVAFIAVASRLADVSSWRPFFGPLSSAYTVRNTWGIFWHQHFRQRLAHLSSIICHDTLGLRKDSFVYRYALIFLAFSYSGFLHKMFYLCCRDATWNNSSPLGWFLYQPGAILFEDLCVALYSRFTSSSRQTQRSKNAAWQQILGYAWVAFWFIWCTPWVLYEDALQKKGEAKDIIIPFSVIRAGNAMFQTLQWK